MNISSIYHILYINIVNIIILYYIYKIYTSNHTTIYTYIFQTTLPHTHTKSQDTHSDTHREKIIVKEI